MHAKGSGEYAMNALLRMAATRGQLAPTPGGRSAAVGVYAHRPLAPRFVHAPEVVVLAVW